MGELIIEEYDFYKAVRACMDQGADVIVSDDTVVIMNLSDLYRRRLVEFKDRVTDVLGKNYLQRRDCCGKRA